MSLAATAVGAIEGGPGILNEEDAHKQSTTQRSPKNTAATCPVFLVGQVLAAKWSAKNGLDRRPGSRGRLRLRLPTGQNSHWQGTNLWGLPQCHTQMGFNECGDDNDDNYSNATLSVHPREASAAFVIWLSLRGDPPS